MKPVSKLRRYVHFAALLAISSALLPARAPAEETNKLSFDVSLYGLAAGMSGNTVVKGIPANVDVGFDKIWDHLKFGAMGTARVGYGRWAFSTDVIYMDLQANEGRTTVSAQQWMVEPVLEYRFCDFMSVYAGARYNNLNLEVDGPLLRNPSDTQGWWDPVIGARVRVPIWKKLSFNVSGDVGGFSAGSDLSWQAYPYLNWQFTELASVQLGYRWLYSDYETGSGLNKFKYDVLSQGVQVGFTLHF